MTLIGHSARDVRIARSSTSRKHVEVRAAVPSVMTR